MNESRNFPSRHIWLVSSFTAIIVAVPLAVFIDRAPWLLLVPIAAGVSLIVVHELETDIPFFPIIRNSLSGILSLQFSSFQERKKTNDASLSKFCAEIDCLPPKPDGFIPPSDRFLEEFNSIMAKKGKMILTGQPGSGKTTFAIEVCRGAEGTSAHQVRKQIPILIPLSQIQRTNGLLSLFVEQVSQSLERSDAHDMRKVADQMIRDGSLLLVIDDLDYLGKKGHKELERFISRWDKNSYVCIISERPPYPFLQNFESVAIDGWSPITVKKYIERRIQNKEESTKLIQTLERGHVLDRALTPWQTRFLVDTYFDGRFYELLELGGNDYDINFELLDHYLAIVIKKAGMEYSEGIKELGKLSLTLLKKGRSSFVVSKTSINESLLQSLIGKMFKKQTDADSLAFVHGNYQFFLAGRYLGQFWPTAKADLKDSDSWNVIWTPVYNCARKFIQKEYLTDLDDSFHALGAKKIDTPRTS